MNKLFFAVALTCFLYSTIFAEKKAESIMKPVFDNAAVMTTADVNLESYVIEDKAGKTKEVVTLKKILLKKPSKIKIAVLDASGLTATTASAVKIIPSAETEDIIATDQPVALYPECLFDISTFLKNFEFKVLEKDERIKNGMEEIIAIKKEQVLSYPQIRILVKAGRVQEMKFYSISGKKYYSIKINEYKKIGNIDMAINITEEVFSKKNKITNQIKYTKVELNKSISELEFQK